jgi:hypothetical protein
VIKGAFWKLWASRLWITGLVLFGAVAIYYRPFSWREFYEQLDPIRLAASLLFILVGKFLTIWLVQQSLLVFREKRDFFFSWYAYSLGDIAKYLPGGIWGFVGTISVFKSSGLSLSTSGRILIFESGVIVAVSLLTGIGLVLAVWEPVILLLIPLVCALAVFVLNKWEVPVRLSTEIVLGQTVAWLFFGASFSVIAGTVIQNPAYSAGVFNVSFGIGTLAVFAPSGIGVREITINFLAGEVSRRLIELAVLHRAIWLVCDIVLCLPILILKFSWRDLEAER